MESALIWCICTLALAGIIQGTLGFGFGMTSMALLPFAISIKEASPVVVLLSLPASFIMFCIYIRHISWRENWALLLGVIIGTPLGVLLLVNAPEVLLTRALGVILFSFAVWSLWSEWHGKIRLYFPYWSSLPIAMLSGALGGAFNTGGPPLVAYTYSMPWSKEKIVATLQVVFVVGAIARILSMVRGGLITERVLQIDLWAALPVFLMIWAGTRIMKRLPTTRLRSIVFAFIGLIGIKFLSGI